MVYLDDRGRRRASARLSEEVASLSWPPSPGRQGQVEKYSAKIRNQMIACSHRFWRDTAHTCCSKDSPLGKAGPDGNRLSPATAGDVGLSHRSLPVGRSLSIRVPLASSCVRQLTGLR